MRESFYGKPVAIVQEAHEHIRHASVLLDNVATNEYGYQGPGKPLVEMLKALGKIEALYAEYLALDLAQWKEQMKERA